MEVNRYWFLSYFASLRTYPSFRLGQASLLSSGEALEAGQMIFSMHARNTAIYLR